MNLPSESDKVVYSWLLLNIPLALVLSVGFLTGILQPFFHDVVFITHGIFALFSVTMLYTGYIAYRIGKMYKDFQMINHKWINNNLRMRPEERNEILYGELMSWLRIPDFIVKFLVGLGFMGTIVGVVIGFQNAPPDIFNDINQMQVFVRQVLVGFAVELHALLMGMLTSMWLSVVVLFLESRLDKFYLSMLRGQVK